MEYTNSNEPQLPWSTLEGLLEQNNLELVGWPTDVAVGGNKNRNKGIHGLSVQEVRTLYGAMEGISLRRVDEDSTPRRAPTKFTKKEKGKQKELVEQGKENEQRMPLHKIQTVASFRVIAAPSTGASFVC